MQACGLTERRALSAIRMSASALRYAQVVDRNGDLRESILALAQHHRTGSGLSVEAGVFVADTACALGRVNNYV